MRFKINYIISITLLIVYIYAVVFKVFPISTKILLEGAGLLYLFFVLIKPNNILKNKYIWIIRYAILIMIWDVITSFINGEREFHLIIAMMTPILSIFAAHLIYKVSKRLIASEIDILKLVAISVFVESVISACMKFVPPFGALVDSLQVVQVSENQLISDLASYYRFIGLGYAAFYGVMPSTVLGLVSSIYLAAHLEEFRHRIMYFCFFGVISAVSFFTARTCIFIILICILLYFSFNVSKMRKIRDVLTFSLPVILTAGFFVTLIGTETVEWAFGFIKNKDVESGSAGTVIDWWLNTHFDFKTLLIGDARYTNRDGIGYYGGVDIGFYREIFYGGIVLLIMHLYYDAKILILTYRCNPERDTKYMMIALFLCHLIILAKGDASMYSYYILILVLYDRGIIYRKRIINKEIYKNERN